MQLVLTRPVGRAFLGKERAALRAALAFLEALRRLL